MTKIHREEFIMRPLLIALLYTAALLISSVSHAEMDVDDADSLRFQSFHEKKNGGLKVYDAKKGGFQLGESKEAKKVYEQQASSKNEVTSSTAHSPYITTSPSSAPVTANEKPNTIQGKKKPAIRNP
jgi:hypothetical protein